MALVIRPARAEDAEAAAPLVFTAGPDAFNYVFSYRTRMNAVAFLQYAFACPGGGFSWSIHWVAELDGEVAGTAAGYTGDQAWRFTVPALKQIVRFYGLGGGAGIVFRGLRCERVIVPPARRDEFYIANVAVAAPLQGRGLGQQLFAHLHDEARRRGASVCSLDVSAENPRAEALYQRLGYRVIREIPSGLRNAAGHVANHRRMERGTEE